MTNAISGSPIALQQPTHTKWQRALDSALRDSFSPASAPETRTPSFAQMLATAMQAPAASQTQTRSAGFVPARFQQMFASGVIA